ncbi:DEAD/DEAH box helicase [Yersinia mollaretii]|uniref:DEAD/DEAH box helicase n=1 Tax=Yersinia mollaretii TaxID=33060 RepID=UPI0005E5F8FE|nr:DEAD/DEAH box helicase [Yersinia mollaretii]PJE87641.1 hypothetical protein CU280_11460 [Yersinia mollaretii]CQD39687.1 ski2-like helicase [Yersinia mollaretii]
MEISPLKDIVEQCVFDSCHEINSYLNENKESDARNKLIKLLDYHEKNDIVYTPLVNHLIRSLGLYPYLKVETSAWQERYIYESFKVNVGLTSPITLHREQSLVLKKLLDGESLAVSAPTSFGKSFIIDAFISIKNPSNVVIIVPTIALADETRRRLQKKFSDKYTIITTSDVKMSERNIFIFPQERSVSYISKIEYLDLLIVDEFYKASEEHDKDRAPTLLRAIVKLGKIAKQRYFLSPNIRELKSNPFTKGMEFLHIDFNTVFLEKHELYKQINEDEIKKCAALLDILSNTTGKTLIYAGTYKNIEKVTNLLLNDNSNKDSELLNDFSNWLGTNYSEHWSLTKLVKKGSGIHNGRLHRSLSQIQVKLFEEQYGLSNIISTSSIIEGVNTSAENIVIWKAKNGTRNLKNFMYKNIIGRGGRMFKHFVGKIYLLSAPPEDTDDDLELVFPDTLIGDVDELEFSQSLSADKISEIIAYKEDMSNILGHDNFLRLQREGAFKLTDLPLLLSIALNIANNPSEWDRISFLNSDQPNNWDSYLFKIIKLQPGGWGIAHGQFVTFVKIAAQNWELTLPQLLAKLKEHKIGIDNFFELEKNLTYKLSALLNDVNILLGEIIKNKNTDITPFIFKVSHAFLPPQVYQLEEYGLPRMISRKIHNKGIMNFDYNNNDLHNAIDHLKLMDEVLGLAYSIKASRFETYILSHFIDGITLKK